MQRRTLLKTMLALGVSAALPGCARQVQHASPFSASDWQQADSIRQSIRPTEFPDKDFLLTDFGGLGDNKSDNTSAFAAAINTCHEAGGGRVVVPPGKYLTGPIHLRSNVNLHLSQDATIGFIPEPERYLPAVFTRWEGVELMSYSPLIYAHEQQNIAITGKGVLDGMADDNTWWPWKGETSHAHWRIDPVEKTQGPARTKLFADAERGIPPQQRHYAEGAYLRPPLLQPYSCQRVLIEGVTITNSPFWLINPVLCEDVVVTGVTCRSHGPNSDGCDPESCNRVLIEDCYFDTGDDCIALKSGRNNDGRRIDVPCQNVVVSGCKMRDGHGGIVIGSEISGGARNIFLENCEMSSPNLDRAIRIKTNSLRGGLIENIRIRNVEVGQVTDAIVINFHYEEGDAGDFDPVVRNIEIAGLKVRQARHAFMIRGFERAPIRQLRLSDCNFENVDKPHVIEHVENLTLDQVSVDGDLLSVSDVLSNQEAQGS
ncbi:glycoside hydrolase [Lacimicrobium alkaliphilum]|uniref:Glycoside hydrolase n=2 Tax=Lacimicrobium alkaliphilum TaxID=1526571 RepID=A0A0U3B6P6_9ALTE|nr:glycosyl hydrolase family 28 protein [Lacimicrobium alkaliphilum]ALS97317.1 glycoside hydrolase [Lacimicrobium alkaliphilum]